MRPIQIFKFLAGHGKNSFPLAINKDKQINVNLFCYNRIIRIWLIIILANSPILVFGQTWTPKSDCISFNKFMDGSQLGYLKQISDTVYASGKTYLNAERHEDFRELDSLLRFLDLGSDYSLQHTISRVSRFDDNVEYRRYQEYYKGVKVEGGGLTASYRSPNGPTGPDEPCLELFMLSPYLHTDINVSVNYQTSISQIPTILNVAEINNAELIIEQFDCNFQLMWKVDFLDTVPKTSWVDANTGVVLKTIESRQCKNAPTVDYGTQDLNDSEQNFQTRLISQNGNIRTYDFAGANIFSLTTADYLEALIPSSNINNDWDILDADPNVYQAHWVTDNAAIFYELLGIQFRNLHVGANCVGENAFAFNVSDLSEGFIAIGESDGNTLGVFDIIGHEMGHVFLNEFLDYDEPGNASLHEGISDMLGVFIEMEQNSGAVDWEIGEDVPFIVRDLESPNFDCFEDVDGFGFDQRHVRSTPLGHWFFISSTDGTPSINVLPTLNILLEALNFIGSDSDYGDLIESTLLVTEENFGKCSPEYVAINNAWEEICVETGNGILSDDPCDFKISGPSWVCEEDNYAKFCVEDGLPGAQYTWRIIGSQSTGYESVCGMLGNTQEGCKCLTLTDFPKYPYYPQYITIKIYSPTVGPDFTVYKRVKLVDCNRDDPTCDEYHNSGLSDINNTFADQIEREYKKSKFDYQAEKSGHETIVFDLSGRVVLRGVNIKYLYDRSSLTNGVYIIAELDENGNIKSTKKQTLIR